MNFFILFFFIIISIELIIKFKYFSLINSLIKLIKKSTIVIANKKVSDNWKERIIPMYSLRMVKSSLSILFIFVLVICIFFIIEKFNDDFLNFIFSLKGILASILFGFGYIYVSKILKK